MNGHDWFVDVLTERYAPLHTFAANDGRATVLVHDFETGGERVLKLWRLVGAERPPMAELQRLLQLAHPRLVRPFELAQFDNNAVTSVAMEFVDGVDASLLIGRLSPLQALNAARAVAEGLHFLHERGVIHGDIKPENLLVPLHALRGTNPRDRLQGVAGKLESATIDAGIEALKLADFGLSVAPGERALGGTPAYMPPEALDRPLDARADIFSLGTLLWELLSGKRLGVDPGSRLLAPSQLNPVVTPSVDELVLSALADDPGQRPDSASTVLAELDALIEDFGGGGKRRGALLLMANPHLERPDVQRLLSRAAVHALADPESSAGTVLLVGERGAGKTTLLDWLARSHQLGGGEVRRLVSHPIDRGREPFERLAGVRRDVDAQNQTPGTSVVRQEFDADAQRAQAITHQAAIDDALITALEEHLPRTRRTLLLVDDADRLPETSRRLLRRVVCEGRCPAVAVVASVTPRAGDWVQDPHALRFESTVDTVEIPPLAASELVQALTAEFADAAQPEILAQWLERRSAGHPGRLASLLDQAVDAGGVLRGTNGYRVDAEVLQALPELGEAAACTRRALALVSPAAQNVAFALAMLDGRASRAQLTELLEIGEAELGDALAELFVHRLCQVTPEDVLELGAGLPVGTVLGGIEPGWKRDLHERAVDLSATDAQRYRHHLGAEQFARAAQTALALARQAHRAGHQARAASHFRDVASLTAELPDVDRREALDEALVVAIEADDGELLDAAGRRLLAVLPAGSLDWALVAARTAKQFRDWAALDRALEVALAAGDRRVEAEVQLARAWLHGTTSNLEGVEEAVERVREIAAELDDTLLARHAASRLGNALQVALRPAEAAAAYAEACTLARRAGATHLETRSLVNLAMLEAGGGDTVQRLCERTDALLERTRELGSPLAEIRLLGVLARLHAQAGHWQRARALHQDELGLARRAGDPSGEASAHWGLGYVARQSGSLTEAERHYRSALTLSTADAFPLWRAQLSCNLAEARFLQHDPDAAQRHAEEALELVRGIDYRPLLAEVVLARLALQAGHHADALARARDIALHFESTSRDELELQGDLVEVFLECGEWETARRLTALLRLQARGAGPRLAAVASLARARVVADTGKVRALRWALARAAKSCETAGVVADRWLTEFAIGTRLLAADPYDAGLLSVASDCLRRGTSGLRRVGGWCPSRIEVGVGALSLVPAVAGSTGMPLAVLECVHQLFESLDQSEALIDRSLDLVMQVTGAERGVIILKHPRTGRLTVAAVRGTERKGSIRALEVARSVIRSVLSEGEPVVTQTPYADGSGNRFKSLLIKDITAVACEPMMVEDLDRPGKQDVVGAVYIDSRGASHLALRASRTLPYLAHCIAAAVHRGRLYEARKIAYRRLRRRNIELEAERSDRVLLGEHAVMRALQEKIERYAEASDLPVLIHGESGTGKGLVAREIHRLSSRSAAPFVYQLLADVPKDLLRTTVFGVRNGTATGVTEDAGLLTATQNGTLFLDEFTEVGQALQRMLLAVIEQREFHRVGEATKPQPFNGRLIVATNRNLERGVKEGLIRADFYHRVSTLTVRTPALREHPEDIPLLVEHFFTAERRLRGQAPAPPPQFMTACQEQHWPGNVRELKNLVTRCAVSAKSSDDWMRVFREYFGQQPGQQAPDGPGLDERVRAFERQEIEVALATTGGNRSAAARLLRIPEATLRYKLKRHQS